MDKLTKNCLLSINGGSSSIKYALYEIKEPLNQLLSGEMEAIGSGSAKLHFIHSKAEQKHHIDIAVTNHTEAAEWLITWLEKEIEFIKIIAIGHRIVQGMEHTSPEKITDYLINYLDPRIRGIKTTSTVRNVSFYILDHFLDLERTFLLHLHLHTARLC